MQVLPVPDQQQGPNSNNSNRSRREHVQEFVAFASDLVHSGPDTFFARVGKEAMIQTAIVPGAAHFLQKVHPHVQQHIDTAQSCSACLLKTIENASMRLSRGGL